MRRVLLLYITMVRSSALLFSSLRPCKSVLSFQETCSFVVCDGGLSANVSLSSPDTSEEALQLLGSAFAALSQDERSAL